MLSDLFGIGRAYRRLPPHQNFQDLADNVEQISNYLLNRSLGSFATEGYLKAPHRWEWRMGTDLKMLLDYARAFVPPETDGLHHRRTRREQ
jgi:hypothetical protein